MKIFGLGLSRSGTKSLTLGLAELGFRIKHYPRDQQTLDELMAGNYRFTILKDLDGITDVTVAPFYAQLDKLYPGSKFILTVRDKAKWLAAIENFFAKTIEPKKLTRMDALLGRKGNPKNRKDARVLEMRTIMRFAVYGSYSFNAERFSYVYDLHHRSVAEYFRDRPESLLTINICGGEGWEKLCPFLGREIPSTPFPNVQAGSELKATH